MEFHAASDGACSLHFTFVSPPFHAKPNAFSAFLSSNFFTQPKPNPLHSKTPIPNTRLRSTSEVAKIFHQYYVSNIVGTCCARQSYFSTAAIGVVEVDIMFKQRWPQKHFAYARIYTLIIFNPLKNVLSSFPRSTLVSVSRFCSTCKPNAETKSPPLPPSVARFEATTSTFLGGEKGSPNN